MMAILGGLGRRPELGVIALMAVVLAMLVIPLPTFLIDTLIGLNICLAIMIFVGSFYMTRILDFSTFPSVLLITTLFRLSLSISTTRMILLQADAGKIIETFGEFVIGSDVAIGVVVFIIVTLVQFIVITKGAERVAEVCARFALDGLPGKQMSIDSDMRAGLIDGDQAAARRKVLEKESQLLGSLDGTMKFIKGDAIAGLVIIFVNFVGGMWMGIGRNGMSFSDALATYTLLTVGDGLVSQIPALLIAIAAGFIVTRVSDDGDNLAARLSEQLFANDMVLGTSAVLAVLIGLLPGFPWMVFFGIASVLGAIVLSRKRKARLAGVAPGGMPGAGPVSGVGPGGAAAAADARGVAASIDNVLAETVPIMLLLNAQHHARMQGLDLSGRIRQRAFVDLGVKLPALEVRYREDLPNTTCRVFIHEIKSADFDIHFGRHRFVRGGELAVGMGLAVEQSVQPDGSSSYWIDSALAQRFQSEEVCLCSDVEELEARVLDTVARNIVEFFGIQETKNLLDEIERKYPELVKEACRHATIQRIAEVLQRLLQERISIRNLKAVLESIALWAPKERDTIMLVEHVRGALARYISEKFSRDGRLGVLTVQHALDDTVRQGIRQSAAGTFLSLDPDQSDQIIERFESTLRTLHRAHRDMVVLCAVDTRRFVKRLIEVKFPDLQVISFGEIADGARVDVLGTL